MTADHPQSAGHPLTGGGGASTEPAGKPQQPPPGRTRQTIARGDRTEVDAEMAEILATMRVLTVTAYTGALLLLPGRVRRALFHTADDLTVRVVAVVDLAFPDPEHLEEAS